MKPMTNQQHPITPPPELVHQLRFSPCTWLDQITNAYQAGADQELEACVDVLGGQWEWDVLSQCTGWKEFRDQSEEILRAARRPKPPSRKEQALEAIGRLCASVIHGDLKDDAAIVRRALEQLDD